MDKHEHQNQENENKAAEQEAKITRSEAITLPEFKRDTPPELSHLFEEARKNIEQALGPKPHKLRDLMDHYFEYSHQRDYLKERETLAMISEVLDQITAEELRSNQELLEKLIILAYDAIGNYDNFGGMLILEKISSKTPDLWFKEHLLTTARDTLHLQISYPDSQRYPINSAVQILLNFQDKKSLPNLRLLARQSRPQVNKQLLIAALTLLEKR